MSQEAEADKQPSTSPSDPAATLPAASPDPKSEPVQTDQDDEDAVLARLTGGDQQTKKTEEPPAKEEASEDEPPQKDDKAEEESEAEDFDHTKSDPDEDKGMNPRTKKRIDKFLAERQEMAPLANWAAPKINKAAQAGIRQADFDKGTDLMIGFLAGDPEADKQIVAMVKSAGLIKETPAAPAKPNFDAQRALVNRMLKVDYAISEEAHAAMMKSFDEAEAATKEPEKKAEPAPERKEAPPQQFSRAEIEANVRKQAALNAVGNMHVEFEAEHGKANWESIHKAAYAKIGEWEKTMPPGEVHNYDKWPARLAKAVGAVLQERASKKSAIRPSNSALRSTNTPPGNVKRHEPGTEEHDLALLTSAYSPDEE